MALVGTKSGPKEKFFEGGGGKLADRLNPSFMELLSLWNFKNLIPKIYGKSKARFFWRLYVNYFLMSEMWEKCGKRFYWHLTENSEKLLFLHYNIKIYILTMYKIFDQNAYRYRLLPYRYFGHYRISLSFFDSTFCLSLIVIVF